MNRQNLIAELRSYNTTFAEEKESPARFLQLLAQERCFHRDHLPGHITGSVWIVNPSKTKVLLVHHAKLNRWLQPGGHADGEENILNVGLREAREETGVNQFKILKPEIFDLDIHTIPARKDFTEHQHYDIRYLVEANDTERIIVSEESHDVKWVSLTELHQYNSEQSVARLYAKLFRTDSV
jgi:8-oxo-dGTP pyrophosphatase MutT (NUDIX family)